MKVSGYFIKKLSYFFLLSSIVLLNACNTKETKKNGYVASLSVSSDGRYVLSAHHGKDLYLWDILAKRKKLISRDANIYSAYFIKDSQAYMWQGQDNIVHVQDIKGQELKTFNPGFADYGHILYDHLEHYVASDKNWSLYQIRFGEKQLLKKGFDGFYSGKTITMSRVKNILLTSGECGLRGDNLPISAGQTARDINPRIKERANRSLMECVVLWDLEQNKAVFKFNRNNVKTVSTLSPDGRYVVAGDENTRAYVWDANTGERLLELDSIFYGKDLGVCESGLHCKWDDTGLLKPPKDFCYQGVRGCWEASYINAIKFIGNKQYLRFTEGVPYAILYDVLNPKPLKYLKLEKPANVYGYMVSNRTDTAPDVGVLVMASAKHNGIVVYQYDKQEQSLKKIWAPAVEDS